MRWPIDLSSFGRAASKRGLTALASFENVALKIFGLESIFSIDWTVDDGRHGSRRLHPPPRPIAAFAAQELLPGKRAEQKSDAYLGVVAVLNPKLRL